ncbi:MAG: tetratricopeptide repeat protein [Deltaproteobacteria bacterium]|nr:tetratricopeptide repeat protein [Deltaproteobacteria bacterium]
MLGKKIIFTIFVLLLPILAWGQSARQLVAQGNTVYRNGKYSKALSLYRQAAKKKPKSPYVQFDLGNAMYKTGNLKPALAAYDRAAANSRNKQFIGKSRFNQGNTTFRAAELKLKSNAKTALKGMAASIHYYRLAMRLDPKLAAAASNIEIVKQRIYKVKQEMARQQAQEKAARKARKKMAKKLRKMAKKQKKMAAKGQNKTGLAAQKKLQQQTKSMADKLAKEQKKYGAGKTAQAQKDLNAAIKAQNKAITSMKKKAPDKAAAQKQAAKKLRQAAKSLNPTTAKKGKKKSEKGKSADKTGKNNHKKGKNPGATAGKSPKPKKSAGNSQAARKKGAQTNQTAADILNEERQNDLRRQEQNQLQNRYEAVDKNW